MNYKVVEHYANLRKAVVADVPDDICFDGLDLNEDEKECITEGLPKLRNCIISIYDSIIEYSKDQPEEKFDGIMTSHIIMKERLEARAYVDKAFIVLYGIMLNGEYDDDMTISLSRDSLKNLKFQQSVLKHYEYFCEIEYLKNGAISDWKKCDSVNFVFDSKQLCFTLRHMIKNGISDYYFQYGDYRIYSKSGKAEDRQNRFSEGVRLKALGEEKYKFYKTLCEKIREILDIEQSGENTYQGGACFQILCDFGDLERYKNTYKNTRISIVIHKNMLIFSVRLGFEAFGKMPEIIEKLSDNSKKGFLNQHQCQSPACTHRCTNKRVAIFDESVFANKVFKPCQYSNATTEIMSEDDINSTILILEHLKKYSIKLK